MCIMKPAVEKSSHLSGEKNEDVNLVAIGRLGSPSRDLWSESKRLYRPFGNGGKGVDLRMC